MAEMAPDCFTAFDLRALGAADQGPLLDALAAGLLRSLDIEQGPIVRAALFDLGPAQPGPGTFRPRPGLCVPPAAAATA